MSARFERSGPLTEASSYPQWAQDMIGGCADAQDEVIRHELWSKMGKCELLPGQTANVMVGLWPLIEGFPGYMARSLLKTRYGRSDGDNLARRWLVRNIRVEQNHAQYWLDWAEGSGVPRETVMNGPSPRGTQVLADWCLECSAGDTLAAGVAATNYAVEGATGCVAQRVYESEVYRSSFPNPSRKASLRWLEVHAAYDDQHPWEALEIVCTILGTDPDPQDVAHIGECVRRTYTAMRVFSDRCMASGYAADAIPGHGKATVAA